MHSDEGSDDDTREAPPAGGSYGQSGIGVGMLVVSADGDPIGYVKDVRDQWVLIDRPLARDITIPRERLRAAGDHMQLDIPASQLNDIPRQPPAR
jgi:hypothetical protein